MLPTICSIYKATNIVNQKCYIGFDSHWPNRQRSHKYLAEAFKDNMLFHKAIRKHGWKNFSWEILYQSKHKEHTKDVMESYFITEYGSTNRNRGYNVTQGGDGVFGYKHSEDHKTRMSKLNKGKVISLESRERMSLAKKGKQLSEERRVQVIKNLIPGTPSLLVIQKRSELCSKLYKCIAPDGSCYEVKNLMKFCKKHCLNPRNMYSVARGRDKTHRGWKCLPLKDNNNEK